MREIKFKLVDNNNIVLGPYALENIYMIGSALNWENCRWLQFTGLLDSKGVEIYEGDILNTGRWEEMDNGHKQKIEEQWQVYWDSTMGGWRLLGCKDGDTDTLYACKDTYEAEIIGNIYQNPELINAPPQGKGQK